MKNLIAIRSKNILFNILMFFAAFTFMLVWLPLLRCLFDGNSYQWAQQYYGITLVSKGLSADYLALVFFLIIYMALFSSFYWIKNRVIFYALLIWWWLHVFGNLLFEIIQNGDTQFHGDTLNVHVSLSAIVIPLAIIAAILIFLVIRKDRQTPDTQIKWSKPNTQKALFILGPLPIQAILFATGEPHGITDQIGVLIAIAQSYLFPIIFFPAKNQS